MPSVDGPKVFSVPRFGIDLILVSVEFGGSGRVVGRGTSFLSREVRVHSRDRRSLANVFNWMNQGVATTAFILDDNGTSTMEQALAESLTDGVETFSLFVTFQRRSFKPAGN
jgi:hypothetical protein